MRYFELIGKETSDELKLNVRTVDAVVATCKILKKTLDEQNQKQNTGGDADGKSKPKVDTLRWYLTWHAIKSFCAFDLPEGYTDAHFDFYQKVLQGTKAQKPRWKRAL